MPDARPQQTQTVDERLGRALAVSQSRPPIAVSRGGGGLVIKDAAQALQVAEAMARSGQAVRPFMRGNVGTCLAVVVQAIEWEFSPFAVAQKAFMVNDQLSYESQLVQAVILKRAPIKGRMRFAYDGEDALRRVTVKAFLNDDEAVEPGDFVELTTPRWKDVNPKNSPLWKSDPDQQFSYYGGRALCRRYFPDVLLGVYTEDEIDRDAPPLHTGAASPALTGAAEGARPASPSTISDRLDRIAAQPSAGPVIDHREDEREAEEQRDRAESPERVKAGEHPPGGSRARFGEALAAARRTLDDVKREDDRERADDAAVTEAEQDAAAYAGAPPGEDEGDRVPDGVGQSTHPQDEDDGAGFPGDRIEAERKEAALRALRQAASDGGRALDKAAGQLKEADLALMSEEERRGIRAIADEVDQRAQRRGGRR